MPHLDLIELVIAGDAERLRQALPQWDRSHEASGPDEYLRARKILHAVRHVIRHKDDACLNELLAFFGDRLAGPVLEASAEANRMDLLERFIPLTHQSHHASALQDALHHRHPAMVARLVPLAGERACIEMASHMAEPEALDMLAGLVSPDTACRVILAAPRNTPLPSLQAYLKAETTAAHLEKATPAASVQPRPRRV